MKFIESIKLHLRANKYKTKYDKGGIAYLNSSVKQGQTVLDIGAHKAGYTWFLLKQVGNNGKVFAFEPQLRLFQYIKKVKELLKWNNLTIENLALSDTAGTVTLYIPTNKADKGSSPGATIVEHKDRLSLYATQPVATDTLDAYCIKHNIKPAFLKVDVEGNELKIFQGGIITLKENKPRILVEIEARHVGQERALQTFKYMESIGYKGYFLHGLNQMPLSEFSFEKFQNRNNMKLYCNNFIFE